MTHPVHPSSGAPRRTVEIVTALAFAGVAGWPGGIPAGGAPGGGPTARNRATSRSGSP